MPRNLTTLWTAAWRNSNVSRTCPGAHLLPHRPEVHYVISRTIDAAAAATYLADSGRQLQPGQVVGAVPEQMDPDGYLISTLVTDVDELATFADLMADDEQLGTVPAQGRPPILLTEQELGDFIDEYYRAAGDVLFRKEALPWYDVPSQNADRAAWLADRFDPAQVQTWTDRLAADEARGMLSKRLRVISADVTADEAMALDAALPIIDRHEAVRILRRGEHLVPDIVDHDYFVIQPLDSPVRVLAMRYTEGGALLGGEVIPPEQHAPYLREMTLGWAIGEPFADWWAAHPGLHRHKAA